MATLLDALCHRIRAGVGWPGVSILWLGEIAKCDLQLLSQYGSMNQFSRSVLDITSNDAGTLSKQQTANSDQQALYCAKDFSVNSRLLESFKDQPTFLSGPFYLSEYQLSQRCTSIQVCKKDQDILEVWICRLKHNCLLTTGLATPPPLSLYQPQRERERERERERAINILIGRSVCACCRQHWYTRKQLKSSLSLSPSP